MLAQAGNRRYHTTRGTHANSSHSLPERGEVRAFAPLEELQVCVCVGALGASEGGAFGPLEELQALILN